MTLEDFFKKTGETQSNFARKSGIDKALLCKYVSNDKRPTLLSAVKIKVTSHGAVTEYDSFMKEQFAMLNHLQESVRNFNL
jgi:hypothetical protein